MRNIFIIVFIFLCSCAAAQTPVKRSSAAVTAEDARVAFMLNMKIPVANDTTLNGGLDSIGLLIYRKIDSCIYLRVPVNVNQNKWINIMTSQEIDTTSLSNRINQKLNISDTASMLSKYLRSIDTASLSNRINQKLNISDTSSMLSKYLRKTDTTAMLAPYLRKVDTASLSQRINLKVNISDTASMLSKYLRKTDTASLSNRINLRLLISDTASMLSKYLRKIDTLPRFNPIPGTNMTITGTYPNMTFNSSGSAGVASSDTVGTTNAMISYGGAAYTLMVKDSMRGGWFYYTTSSATPDSGIVFPATGKGSGYWVRRYDQKTWRLSWFGIIGDGVTDYSSRIRFVCSLIRARGGVHLIIPEGTYIVSRGLSGGVQQMFLLGSNTWIEGEGIDKTILKLNPLDNFNFRRMFAVAQTDTVQNIEISNLTVDMSNTYTTYPPPPEFGADAQNAAVFLYSQDYIVRNVFVHDIKTINITGDCVVASRNSENIEFNRIYMRDYLRTGGDVGGDAGGKNLSFIKLVNLPNQTVVLGTGGEGFHSEPFNHLVQNVTLRDCYLDAFTGSGISNLLVDNVTTFTSKTCQINNSNGVKVVNSHMPLAELKIAPYGDGNIIVANNDSLRSLRITYVSDANPNPPGAIQVHHNNILTSNETAVEINSISNVEIHHNYIVTDTGRGIYLVNNLSEKVHNNTIIVNGGGTYSGVYTLMTAGAFGAGMSSYANNVIKSPYRGIWGISKSIKLGINFIDAPTKVILTGDISKIFPVVDGGGKQILTAQSTTFPNYGTYSLGDIVEPKTTTRGQPLQYVCTTAGSLYRGAWSSDTVYYVNEYVRDTGSGGSTNYIYVSIAPGGQAEDPSNDTDNTYWRLASTTVAAFTQANVLGMLFSGSGSPEGVVTAGVGAIYLNMTATSTADLLFGKITGSSNTGWDTLNTGGGSGGTYIQSLNGQTQATQTFGTPTVTTVGPSVTSSAGVHTINIPVAKMINDSLTAQPIVNMYIQNLAKQTCDTILRVIGDTLKAKGIDVRAGTGITVTPLITDSSIVYQISLPPEFSQSQYMRNTGNGDTLFTYINDTTNGIKTIVAGLNLFRTITDSTIIYAIGDSATFRLDTLNNRVQLPQTARLDIYNTLISVNNETGSLYWSGNKMYVRTTGGGTGNAERPFVFGAGTKTIEINTNYNTAPASATDTGTTGEIRVAAMSGTTYLFYCISTNTWVRVALNTW